MIGLSGSFLEKLPYIQTMYHKRTNSLVAALSGLLFSTLALVSGAWVRAQQPQPPAGPAAAPAAKAAEPPPNLPPRPNGSSTWPSRSSPA